jgi:pRiA4b ORF-3-like protein
MADDQRDTLEATALVRWLLEAGVGGLGLTKTHALQRVVVREAAERWPQWWNHKLFGPPHREAELPMLQAAHDGLRRLRLLRRQRETLRTTARGRQLLADPDALLAVLYGDMGAQDRFDADAWPLVEAALRDRGPLDVPGLTESVRPLLHLQGWRDEDGTGFDEHSLWHALHPLLCQAEGYGLVQRTRGAERLTLELSAAGRRLATGGPPARMIPAAPGDAALIFDAELLNARGVRARLAVLERQDLTALHDAIQQAFGWWDDHLYSFWLDGSFFGDPEVELTTPDTPDEGVRTADVPIAELDLHVGQRLGYVFDFGDDWRVRLTFLERVAADRADYPRVLQVRGTPPPQYPALDA